MIVRFKDLKLQAEKQAETIELKKINVKFNGSPLGDITIKRNIPVEIIKTTIDDIVFTSFYQGGFSPTLYEVSTRLAIITMFTDIVFTAKEKEKPYVVYNTIETLGIYPQIIKAIDPDEYKTFISLLEDSIEYEVKHRSSMQGIVDTLINSIPKLGEAAVQGLQGFNPEQLTTLMEVINGVNNLENIVPKHVAEPSLGANTPDQ